MRPKKIIVFAFALLTLTQFASAQSPAQKKPEQAFLAELNNILINSKEQHWAYTGAMTVDSAFTISKNGELTVTVRYKDNDEVVVSRMAAPMKEAKWVEYDLYIILQFNGDVVSSFETEKNGTIFKELEKTNYFHIGVPFYDGYERKEKIQKMLKELLKYYK